ncbi:UCH domain-containing protein [Cephalotus follicularis]|uniref:Ubiquitin carboxyl-terminal hydrolase n=1 Tax=Cephalotus follicularis TaxID=3775 RepID=A0A1Q3AQT2_CEPFO|nr:UCH domain-containing protein [Cephalotus follicularis]
MEAYLFQNIESTSSDYSDSVVSKEIVDGSLHPESAMADSAKTLDGFSVLLTKIADSAENLNGFSCSPLEETLGGHLLVQSHSNPNGSSSISTSIADPEEILHTKNLDGHSSVNGSSTISSMGAQDSHSLGSSSGDSTQEVLSPTLKTETLSGSSLEGTKQVHEEQLHSPMHTETNPLDGFGLNNDEDGDGDGDDDDAVDVDGCPRYFHKRHNLEDAYWFNRTSYMRLAHRWDSRCPGYQRPPLEEPDTAKDAKPTGVGAGLRNMGNTCFINAIMQCFIHTVPLVQGLLSYNHSSPCDRASEGFCIICALLDHIELSFTNSGWMISPSKLVDNLNYISHCFQRHQQEDAHEFLQCLLDKLERCCLDSKSKDDKLSSQDVNLVQQVFGGRLVSSLRCCCCGHCSDTYEPFIDLSLEIDDVDTLPCALESFTKVEKIDDLEMKFTCESCKEKVSVEKRLLLDQAPSIAAFHLKRFKTDGSSVVKIHKHMEFPLELDLQLYASASQNSDVGLNYQLYAVVVHTGVTPTSGHYFCYIRSSQDTWHRLDDEKVYRVKEECVLSQDAYILFYARQGTPWFSSSFEMQSPSLNSDISNTSPKSVLENMDSVCTSNPVGANIDHFETNEFSEVVETSTNLTSGSGHEGVPVNETESAAEEIPLDFNEPQNETHMIDAEMSLGASDHCNGTLCDGKSTAISSPKNPRNENIDEVRRDSGFESLTPPRLSGLDVCMSSREEGSYHIPRNHLKVQNRLSCKKPLRSARQDSQKREALRYVKRNMHKERRMKLMAAMMPGNDVSPSKKKIARSSPCKRGSSSAVKTTIVL